VLENYLREVKRTASVRPPAERRRLENAIDEFERQRASRETPYHLGTLSDSGLHDIRSIETALIARAEFVRIQNEKTVALAELHEARRRRIGERVVSAVLIVLALWVGVIAYRLVAPLLLTTPPPTNIEP